MSDGSLDVWIERLNDGDVEALERVFLAYEPYLRIAVRRRLSQKLRAKVDSGDIVQSVFADVLRGVKGGGWRFSGRSQLHALLRRIARRRLADRYQKHRQAMDKEQPLIDDAPLGLLSDDPRPSEVAQGREAWDRVLQACPVAHREVVRLRMKGYRMAEIAERTGLHEGSVRRILYDLARRLSISRKTSPDTADGPDGS
jgi:RNA polymerase sigma factor (sigma-70 family)